MKGIRYILILLTLCVAVVSCEREEVNRYPIEGTGKLIQFSVESEWPTISKAAINGVEGMVNNMFKVWGTWHQDPSDLYYSKASVPVFTPNGTYVDIVSIGNGIYEGRCKSEAEWFAGYYNFAALYPMTFSATQDTEFEKSTTGNATMLKYTNKLNITFPKMGQNGTYHLGNSQNDLMYAFHNEDNSAETSSVVNLKFNHLFSLLTIKISSNSTLTLPRLNEIIIYGIHSSVSGSFTITQKETVSYISEEGLQRSFEIYHDLKDLLNNAVISTETNPYKRFEFTQTDFDYGSIDTMTPIKDLLVYPETLSDTCPLNIKIIYEEGGITKVKTATINTGEWESGKSYTYTLLTN